MTGKFIVLEGIDGSGTTTIASQLCSTLRCRGFATEETSSPSTGAVGQLLRKIMGGDFRYLLNHDPSLFRPMMSSLFNADRLDHLACEILPAVAQGKIVVSDRYHLSTFAYQMCDEADVHPRWLDTLAHHCRTPDLTLYLKVSAEQAFDRLKKRWEEKGIETKEIYERLDTLRQVEKNYTFIANNHASLDLSGVGKVITIDASPPVADVQLAVVEAVSNYLTGEGLL